MILYQLTKYFIAEKCLDILIRKLYWNLKVLPKLKQGYNRNTILDTLFSDRGMGKITSIDFDENTGTLNINYSFVPKRHAEFITLKTIVNPL
jgi:hypothetical protein